MDKNEKSWFGVKAHCGGGASILDLSGAYEAQDAAEAAAQFIREKFRHGDGMPVKLLKLDGLEIERIEQ